MASQSVIFKEIETWLKVRDILQANDVQGDNINRVRSIESKLELLVGEYFEALITIDF